MTTKREMKIEGIKEIEAAMRRQAKACRKWIKDKTAPFPGHDEVDALCKKYPVAEEWRRIKVEIENGGDFFENIQRFIDFIDFIDA